MKTFLFLLVGLCAVTSVFAGPYAPAVGQTGTDAIAAGDPRFVAWATGVFDFAPGPQDIAVNGSPLAAYGSPTDAFGIADATPGFSPVVSLGDGGHITLSFAKSIADGPGADFAVFENSFDGQFLELAQISVSIDGVNFLTFPSHSLTQTTTQIGPFALLDPTNIDGLAGKYLAGYGTPFDLATLGLSAVNYVRVTDVVGSIDPLYGTLDSSGHLINDPFATAFPTSGFDLDAIGVIHEVPEPSAALVALLGGLVPLWKRHRARRVVR